MSTPTNAPSPSVSRSLPLSQARGTESQGTSRVDFVKPNTIVNQPSAEPDLTGSSTGEHIGLPRVNIDSCQPGSQIITLRKAILHFEEVCMDLWLAFNI